MLSRRGTTTKGTSHSEWHQGAARASKRYNIFYYRDIQSVQNSVPHFVFKTKNLIALLLPGFPLGVVLFLKTFLLVYKSFNAMIPLYLWELLAYHKSSFSLRSTCNNNLNEPSSRTRTYGNRSFAVSASRIWNLLPPFIRRSSSIPFLKETLKTGLFEKFLKEHFKTFFSAIIVKCHGQFFMSCAL